MKLRVPAGAAGASTERSSFMASTAPAAQASYAAEPLAAAAADAGDVGRAVDVASLKTLQEIKAAEETLNQQEDEVNADLESLLSQQVSLETELRGLSLLTPQLLTAETEAEKLAKLIAFTSTLAEKVSAKVKQLDVAKSRVSDCQQRVNDLIDLKLCSDGVKSALVEEDYEQAAAHLHRFLAMDESLLKLTAGDISAGSIGAEANGSGAVDQMSSSLDAALATLHAAEDRVKRVVSQRFDEAVHQEDHASIERFFKIFPLINLHEHGLKKFTAYLCSKLAANAKTNLSSAQSTKPGDPRSSVIFADTLTLLFEGIARTVEIHQPLIETYYGPGRLALVLAQLQMEADQQTETIVGEFRRLRQLPEKCARVREALFTKAPAPAAAAGGAAPVDDDAGKRIEPKDLDNILGEMTLIQARSEMYARFVRKRVTADLAVAEPDGAARAKKQADVERMIADSGICRNMQDLLSDYILMEQFFMAENLQRAMAADEPDPNELTSRLLDDTFFILKKCLKRSLSSCNVDCVCAILNHAASILETDFCSLIQTTLKLGFPSGYLDLTLAYNAIQTSFQQGKIKGGDSERQKLLFLTYLNNADAATEYIVRLRDSITSDVTAVLASKSAHERAKTEHCLAGLSSAGARMRQVLDQGLQQLRQSAVKPRIKPWVDAFLATSRDVDDEDFANFEANDPFVQELIRQLDGLLASFSKSLSPSNYDALVSILTAEVTAQLEKAVLKSKFSRLGGLQFDREVRSLVSFLTSVTTWTIRDKFSRLSQMATLLNLESVSEVTDVWSLSTGTGGAPAASRAASGSGKLSPTEVRQILALRSDFNAEEIKRLRL